MRFSGRVKRILVGGVVSLHEILWQSETDIGWEGVVSLHEILWQSETDISWGGSFFT